MGCGEELMGAGFKGFSKYLVNSTPPLGTGGGVVRRGFGAGSCG
jgi:hypothetical protein